MFKMKENMPFCAIFTKCLIIWGLIWLNIYTYYSASFMLYLEFEFYKGGPKFSIWIAIAIKKKVILRKFKRMSILYHWSKLISHYWHILLYISESIFLINSKKYILIILNNSKDKQLMIIGIFKPVHCPVSIFKKKHRSYCSAKISKSQKFKKKYKNTLRLSFEELGL